jgi:hypothetical protein
VPGSFERSGHLPSHHVLPVGARLSRAVYRAHVKAGQLLASINTPDLNRQFAQAKADLATAAADAPLAAVTAERWNALIKAQWVSEAGNV